MAWSDAARKAALEARRRKSMNNPWSPVAREAAGLARHRRSLSMAKLRKGFRSVEREVFRARVNYENFTNPDWARSWDKDQASDAIRYSRSVINAHRRLGNELKRRVSARTPAQKDAIYARKQRKAGKSSIFGGMTVSKQLKGFESRRRVGRALLSTATLTWKGKIDKA